MRFYHYEFEDTEVIKAWRCPDQQVQTMSAIMPRVPLADRTLFGSLLERRQNWVEGGFANIPQRYQESLQALDPYLRLRWDYEYQCYLIERVDTDMRSWVTIFRWANEDGIAKLLGDEAVGEIVGKLRAGDMRRFATPDDYLAHKRQLAAWRQSSILSQHESQIYAAIDAMTNKQIDEFVATTKALITGETVNAGGQDADMLNHLYDLQQTPEMQDKLASIPGRSAAVNPQHSIPV